MGRTKGKRTPAQAADSGRDGGRSRAIPLLVAAVAVGVGLYFARDFRRVTPKDEVVKAGGSAAGTPGAQESGGAHEVLGAARATAEPVGEQLSPASSPQPSGSTDCDDENPECASWAAMGECQANPGYMHRACGHSCGTCGMQLSPVCNASGPNAVSNGDIEATFSRAASLAEYEPTVLSRDPWVLIFDRFLSREEAAELIKVGGHNFERSLAGDGVTPVRTSSTSWCNVRECESHELIKRVKGRALSIMRIPEGNSEHLQTLRYEVGQFYKMHHDQNADPKSAWGPRVYTFFLYLNDVPEGGGTRFPRLNITVTPKAGRALVWPSVFDHDVFKADMRTEHEALPVIAGEKYASNLWLHMREFQQPLKAGCANSHTKDYRKK